MANSEIYESMIQPRGQRYLDAQIVPHSHYNDAIDQAPGRAAGNSRVWGDASPNTQSRVIDELVAAGERAGMRPREIAYVLATARVESGFNPDAAAGTTSATGLGQFVDRTGASYGITDANRADLHLQAEALVAHHLDNAKIARSRGHGEAYVYKYHHDGPGGEHGGLQIAKTEVGPYLDRYEKFVNEHQKKRGVEATDPELAARAHQQPGTSQHSPLQQGATGQEVTALQTHLGQLGYLVEKDGRPSTPDGSFGSHTRAAIKNFQHDHQLKQSGNADSATLKSIGIAVWEHEKLGEGRHSNAGIPAMSRITDLGHPAQAMYAQAKSAIEKIDAQYGRKSDQFTDNAAASLAVAAARAGITRIDHLELTEKGDKFIAAQGRLGTAQSKVVDVASASAVNTTVAESSAAFAALQQSQTAINPSAAQPLQPDARIAEPPASTRTH